MASMSVERRVTTPSGSTTMRRRRGLRPFMIWSSSTAAWWPILCAPCSTLVSKGLLRRHSSSSLSTPITATSSGNAAIARGRLPAPAARAVVCRHDAERLRKRLQPFAQSALHGRPAAPLQVAAAKTLQAIPRCFNRPRKAYSRSSDQPLIGVRGYPQ
jgi:hypothetical protein